MLLFVIFSHLLLKLIQIFCNLVLEISENENTEDPQEAQPEASKPHAQTVILLRHRENYF